MSFDIKSLIPRRNKQVKTKASGTAKKNSSRFRFPKINLNSAVIALICFLFVIEFVFAINIYAFKSNDNITKQVARVIPYPAAFTTSGIVTVSQYWKEKDYIEHFYASTKQESIDEAELSKQILQQEAENRIIEKQAITYKLNVTDKEVEEAMSQIYENNGGEGEVEKALEDLYGLDVASFKTLVRTQLLRDAINREVIKHVDARHILVRVEEGSDQAKIDEAKARISSHLEEVKGGALSFEEAAVKYSEDVGSNQEGGLLESFARGDMVKEFEDVAFATPEGEISEPFQTSFGWHIIKVESVAGYVDKSFEEWLDDLMKNNLYLELYRD